ncbi:MAG: class I SAM-dependent methyltransferase [Chloroflexi bacterium]|nr:class I SAM-dependent methyltransferase [Chloroflexota bacterium]OJV94809.1 MAG: hypothetical protein BGO39_34105 [Chloroflexi bacterium 54-19]
MFEQARQLDPEIPLVQGRAEQLPFGDNLFDLLFCANAVHHFTDPVRSWSKPTVCCPNSNPTPPSGKNGRPGLTALSKTLLPKSRLILKSTSLKSLIRAGLTVTK